MYVAATKAGRRLGREAEEAAEEWLRRRGATVISRNFSCRFGELDLVATDGEDLVFVEVKSRDAPPGPPSAGFDAVFRVTKSKRLRVLRAAACYLAKHGRPPGVNGIRFDVLLASRVPGGEERYAFEHLRAAM